MYFIYAFDFIDFPIWGNKSFWVSLLIWFPGRNGENISVFVALFSIPKHNNFIGKSSYDCKFILAYYQCCLLKILIMCLFNWYFILLVKYWETHFQKLALKSPWHAQAKHLLNLVRFIEVWSVFPLKCWKRLSQYVI